MRTASKCHAQPSVPYPRRPNAPAVAATPATANATAPPRSVMRRIGQEVVHAFAMQHRSRVSDKKNGSPGARLVAASRIDIDHVARFTVC
jgi:hypothetical protein